MSVTVVGAAWFAGVGQRAGRDGAGRRARRHRARRGPQPRRADAPGAVRRRGAAADAPRGRAAAGAARRRTGRDGSGGRAARRRIGQPHEGRIPRDDLARAADAAQRRARLAAPGAVGQARSPHRGARPGSDRTQRAPAGAAHLRSARRVARPDRPPQSRRWARCRSGAIIDQAVSAGDVGRDGQGRHPPCEQRGRGRRRSAATRRVCARWCGICSPTRSSSRRAAATSSCRSKPTTWRASRCATRGRGWRATSCRASSIASPRPTRRRRATRAVSASGCRSCASWSNVTAATSR